MTTKLKADAMAKYISDKLMDDKGKGELLAFSKGFDAAKAGAIDKQKMVSFICRAHFHEDELLELINSGDFDL